MLDAVFLVALVCGCVAALKGNRTAWALLASTAFTATITVAGVPFNPFVWALIDLAVVVAILHPRMTVCDVGVAVLFIPVWCLYMERPTWISPAVTLIVSLQFLLTFPVPAVCGLCAPMFRRRGPPDILRMIYA